MSELTTIETTQPNALISYEQVERMADAMAKSGLFGVKNKEQMLALMLISQAEGRHPAEAARDYHIIQNKPTLKADALLARFQQSGGTIKWLKYTHEEVSAEFSHPASPDPLTISWTNADAKAAGLDGKEVWKQYPRQMKKSRVISEGVRAVYPAVTIGMYTPDEVRDMPPEPMQETEAQINTPELELPADDKPWIETAEGIRAHAYFDESKIVLGEPMYYSILKEFGEGAEHRTDLVNQQLGRRVAKVLSEARAGMPNAVATVEAVPDLVNTPDLRDDL